MKQSTLILTVISVLIVGLLLSAVTLVADQAYLQVDETAQAETVNALVEQRLNETLQAQQTLDATEDLALTQTAEFRGTEFIQMTVDAALAQTLTATIAAPIEDAVVLQYTLRATRDLNENRRDRIVERLGQRLTDAGLPGSVVTTDGDQIIVLQVPTVEGPDVNAIVTGIIQNGFPEFVDFSGLGDDAASYVGEAVLTTGSVDDDEVAGDVDPALLNPETGELFETVLRGRSFFMDAEAVEDSSGAWVVNFQLDREGGELLREFTSDNIGEPLAFVVDNEVLTVAMIQSEIGDAAMLAGNFTEEEARVLAAQLVSGGLPSPFEVVSIEGLAAMPQTATPIPTATSTPSPTLTPTFDPFPTRTTGEVRVAEQVFENGRMMWVQPVNQIWVMTFADADDTNEGEWLVYEDMFEEGEAELDPAIVPPEGFFQPERGFGKLWRENEDVRDMLGWGVTPEFGYTSDYEYRPGGRVEDQTYIPAPGFHILNGLDGQEFVFDEENGTWEED